MSDAHMTYPSHLPDPEHDAHFYDGVPSRRLVAWFVDFAVITVLSLIATAIFGVLTLGFGFMALPFIFLATAFVYRTLTIASASATWGMRMMGIELRTRMGERFDFGHAAIHTGIFMVLMASIIGWIATVVAILGTRYNQGLPDLVLGTVMINSPSDL